MLGNGGGERSRKVCSKVGLGKIKGEQLLFGFAFAQLRDLDLNLQKNWGPFKYLNLGSDVILIASLHNYSGQHVEDEWTEGEKEDRKITEQVIISEL